MGAIETFPRTKKTEASPLELGYDIRTVQELLGHNDVRKTMIHSHVLTKGGLAVRSPLDEP